MSMVVLLVEINDFSCFVVEGTAEFTTYRLVIALLCT